MNYWLVKSEPGSYSWETFVKDGKTAWTGVRNYQARLYLREMKKGDLVFFYHSGANKNIVGLARVTKENYPDPTPETGDWICVDLAVVKALQRPVSLAEIKSNKLLREMRLARQSRLSVTPVTAAEFKRILELAETKL